MTSVRTTKEPGLVHVELTEPARRNPLSVSMLAALRAALREHVDATVTAVIVSGAGPAFSAGADLTELTGTAADAAVDDAIAETVDVVRRLPALTVAAVEGACVGGAVDLVLSFDLVLADTAAVFAVPAVRLGLLYNPDAVDRWRRRLPRSTVVRLLLAGERLDAEAARAGGLVSVVSPAGTAVASARSLAERMSGCSPTVVAAVKNLLVDLDDGTDLAAAHRARGELLAAPERLDALRTAWDKGGTA